MTRATGPHCSDLTICPDAMGEGGSRGGAGLVFCGCPTRRNHRGLGAALVAGNTAFFGWLAVTIYSAEIPQCLRPAPDSLHSPGASTALPSSAEVCADAWPDLHYQTVKGALLLSPSPPRIAPSQLRLVE